MLSLCAQNQRKYSQCSLFWCAISSSLPPFLFKIVLFDTHHGHIAGCQLDLGIDWPVSSLMQVDTTQCAPKHWKIVAHMCHSVSILGTPCHLHVCGMFGEPCCINHLACTSNMKKLMSFFAIMVLWCFMWQLFKHSGFSKLKKIHSGSCHMLSGFCQLEFWKGLLLRHALIGQTWGTTSWD